MAQTRSQRFVSLVLFGVGCVYPTERSGELTVEMAPIPDFRQGEIDTLAARVVTASGDVVPDVLVQFQSSNPNVVTVRSGGEIQATGFGIALVTAQAIGFQNAGAAEQLVTVKPPVSIDSIRPVGAQYGETVRIYGGGLNPDSTALIEIGGEAPPEYFNWIPVDPEKPNGFGTLDVWIAPLTPQDAEVLVVGFSGAAQSSDTLLVERRDIYEPNDLAPRDLGSIPVAFFNPALAFEQRLRNDLGADWYEFEQGAPGDRTILVRSRQVLNDAFRVILAQQGVFGRNVEGVFALADSGWAYGGPGLQVCNGTALELPFLPGLVVLTAFRDLPAGRYHILVPYGAPAGYEMTIVNQYFSLRAADDDEENDVCSLAKTLVPGEPKQLTIDNPYDPDWFTYTPSATVTARISTTITSEVPGFLDPDLDVFVFRSTRDSVIPVAQSTSVGDATTDDVTLTLEAGQNYLILVTDYAGVPTRYQLSLTIGPPGAAPPGAAAYAPTKIRSGVNLVPGNLRRR